MDVYERERYTRRCLDSTGFSFFLSWVQALIKQILDGNNRTETKVDGLGTRVLAGERKTNGITKKMDSTSERMQRLEAEMQDALRRRDTLLSLASLSSRPTASRGPTDSASTTTTAAVSSKGAVRPDEMEGPIISFTGFPPNSDKFEIKKYIEDTVLSQKHREEVDGEFFGPG